MPVTRLNENTVCFTIGIFTATVRTSSQHVTVFRNGDQPAGTLLRRRVIDRSGHEWTVYDRAGRQLGSSNMVSPLLHILRRDTLQEA